MKDGVLDGIVSLNTNECNCDRFQYFQILCSHAIATARERNINSFTLCSRFYSVESLVLTYAKSISPLSHVSEWKKPPGYVEVKILPQRMVVQVGRRRVNRIQSTGEHPLSIMWSMW